ncbi:MAG: hypothetical protein EZS28_045880, partial [Streblomastix strix]
LYKQPPKVGYDSFQINDELEGGAQGRKYFVKVKETGVHYAMNSVKYLKQADKERSEKEITEMKKLESKFTCVLYIPFKIAQTCTWLWITVKMGTFEK